jgi:polyphosphate kinase
MRLKFLAITAANLDEFFMVRVGGLHDQVAVAIMTKTLPASLRADSLKKYPKKSIRW